ncbi:MAG TPA: NDP-sugar synthase [Nitrospira sp.]|jgi:NDP-sugar pyrophosphorylase family protein|nr:NDP-sugar synthase [Nitrospira sp.]
MKAMILAAGFGTRLRPLTAVTPKPLLPVGGTPMIVWNLLLLKRHGIHDVMINLHHLGAMIEETLGDGVQFGMRISYSREPVILGTGGGIKQVEPWFNGEPALVLNGDTLFDLDLMALISFHRRHEAAATLVLREDPDAARWGLVEVTEQSEVIRITGHGRTTSMPTSARMFAGIHVFHPRLLQVLVAGQESSIIDAYVEGIREGERIMGFDFAGYWNDVGTPERYAKVQQDVASGLLDLSARKS